jgi:hypothetical protein
MEIEFQNSKEDYIEFYKLQLKNSIQKKLAFLVIISFLIIGEIVGKNFEWRTSIVEIIAYSVFLACVVYLIPVFIITIRINNLLAKDNAYLEKRKFIITDEGLISEKQNHTILRNWETIASVDSNEKFIYLKLVDKKTLIIPKRFFLSDTQAINFIGQIRNKINKTYWEHTSTDDHYIEKPPYNRGWWSLLPLIGGIHGIIMIVNGIFRYKDTKYALLGLGGILVTVAVYAPLVYKSRQGTAFVDMSKMQLNGLVKEIEFYKLQNGTYPDSLEQLDIKDGFTSIHDPILNIKDNDKYNYHKIRNKYTLFSSGLDQIPNTSDDIYPSLSIDTSKIGLIIKRK